MEFYTSRLDESGSYPNYMWVKKCDNDMVTLKNDKTHAVRQYIDFICAYAAVNFGHCNKEIDSLSNIDSDLVAGFLPEEAEELSCWLVKKLGLENFRVLYQVGGSSAVSTALALAQHKKPGKILAVNKCFHGLGLDTLSITDIQKKLAIQNTLLLNGVNTHIVHIEPLTIPKDWSEISSFIYEPIQGAAGYIPLNASWLNEMISEAKRHGVTTISDEIQCGYYRFGSFSVSKKLNLSPDIYLFSKSMTNGNYPTSAIVYDEKIESFIKGSLFLAHTFQNSSRGIKFALSVARYIDNTDLQSAINFVENKVNSLADKLENSPLISNLYRLGPAISFSMKKESAKELVSRCFHDGLLIFLGGDGDRVRLAPPLTVTISNIDRAIEIIISNLASMKEHYE